MLKRVSIQNFKSLKDVTLDLQKVNLLIGPNNSGKTNFLKALELIGFGRKLNKHGINQIAFAKNAHNKIDIKLLWPSNIGGYDFEIWKFFFENGELDDIKGLYNENQPDQVTLGHRHNFPISLSELEQTKIYKPDPNKFTQPGPVGTGAENVNADASNLVGFLDLMLGKYRRPVFNRTEKDLQSCIPEFDEINLEDALPTDELKKQFGDRSFKMIGLTNSKQGITYWAEELSEGTLYFLALLCIVNQPNPPKLLLLEEPEKGIHPRRIREVMDFIFRLAEEKDVQIILTTHNEHVLDDFATRHNPQIGQVVRTRIQTAISKNPSVSRVLKETATYCAQSFADSKDPCDLFIAGIDLDKPDFTDELIHHAKRVGELQNGMGKVYRNYSSQIILYVPVQAIDCWVYYIQQNANANSQESAGKDDIKKKVYGFKNPDRQRIIKVVKEAVANADFDKLAKQSKSFAHFHKQVNEFMATYSTT